MGKSGKCRRQNRRPSSSSEEDISYEDSKSTGEKSDPSRSSKGRGFELNDWNSMLENLLNNRPGKRSVYLKLLHTLLCSEYLPDQIAANCNVLIPTLVSSIDKGGEESEVACDCLSNVLLTLGQDEISAKSFKDVCDVLRKASKQGRSGLVRLRSSLCFGILTFLGCNDDVYVDEANAWFLNTCTELDFEDVLPENAEPDSGLFNGAPASAEVSYDEAFSMSLLQAEGLLYGWILLATQWRTSTLADWDACPASELLEFSCRCIVREAPKLRSIAGFALALLCEAKWKAADVDNDPYSLRAFLAELESRYSHVVDHLRTLSSGERCFEKGLTKEQRRNQKALFRMFLKTAECGEGPSRAICRGSRACTTQFNSWLSYVRYDIFRIVLKEALATHMISNQTIIRFVNAEDQNDSFGTTPHTTEKDLTTHVRERKGFHREVKKRRDNQRKAKGNFCNQLEDCL